MAMSLWNSRGMFIKICVARRGTWPYSLLPLMLCGEPLPLTSQRSCGRNQGGEGCHEETSRA